MIQDGDRILVCLSGGKDSLSLLHTLRQYQFAAKPKVSSIIHVNMIPSSALVHDQRSGIQALCVHDLGDPEGPWLWCPSKAKVL